eukprot:4496853-Prymnesium_polylepis.1
MSGKARFDPRTTDADRVARAVANNGYRAVVSSQRVRTRRTVQPRRARRERRAATRSPRAAPKKHALP